MVQLHVYILLCRVAGCGPSVVCVCVLVCDVQINRFHLVGSVLGGISLRIHHPRLCCQWHTLLRCTSRWPERADYIVDMLLRAIIHITVRHPPQLEILPLESRRPTPHKGPHMRLHRANDSNGNISIISQLLISL